MIRRKNPATSECGRASNISSLAGVDVRNPTDNHHEVQSEILAVRSVMRRFCVSSWHAKTICQLSGLGGQHA